MQLQWRRAGCESSFHAPTYPWAVTIHPKRSWGSPNTPARTDNQRTNARWSPPPHCYTWQKILSWMCKCLLRNIDLVFNRSTRTNQAKNYARSAFWFPDRFEDRMRFHIAENLGVKASQSVFVTPDGHPTIPLAPFGLPHIRLVRLLFSAETVFFSHSNSARTVFSSQFQPKFCQPNSVFHHLGAAVARPVGSQTPEKLSTAILVLAMNKNT